MPFSKIAPSRALVAFVLCLFPVVAASQFGSAWVQVKQSAPWQARNAFASAVFDNKLWLMGGALNSSFSVVNDVWSTANGVDWTQVDTAADWSARRDFAAIGYNGFLWVIGGQDQIFAYPEVWRSANGTTWTRVNDNAPFGQLIGHSTLVFDNKMWVIGGFDWSTGTFSNSAWSSTDGVTWTETGMNLPWTGRSALSAAVFNSRIYISGGSVFNFNTQSFTFFNDVWSTNNGSNWTRATAAAGWEARDSHTSATALGRIWVMGGFFGNFAQQDVWNSTDGATWTRALVQAPWPRRVYPQAQQFGSRLYLFGGANSDDGVLNDVWYTSNGGQISGKVTSSADDSPLTCVAVLIVGPGYRRVAVTDARGEYQQDEVPQGAYTLTFFTPGFAGGTAQVNVSESARTFASKSFAPAVGGTVIRGQVTDGGTGQPVPAIRVRLLSGATQIAVTYTCAEGRYQFRNPNFAKGGDETIEFSDDIDGGYDTEEDDITPPAPNTELVVNQSMTKAVGAPGTLAGAVINADNSGAISGAKVTIEGIANATATTPGNGTYTFAALPTGTYTVRASANGFASAAQIATIAAGVAQLNFTLKAAPASPPGDVNGDGVANAADIQATINAALGISTGFDSDLNQDGSVNAVDVQLQVNIVLGIA